MGTQIQNEDVRWYETDFGRSLQEKCDSVSTELCDAAIAEEMQRPFEIEFLDGRGSFAELTVDEDRAEWNWDRRVRDGQEVEEPLTARLKSRDGRSLCRKNFSLAEKSDRMPEKSLHRGNPYNLAPGFENRFDKAFECLGPRWETLPEIQRRVLVFVALDCHADFVAGPLFEQEVKPLFQGFDSKSIVACLNEIRNIREAIG
jgi:hypothetical protein